MPTKGNNKPPPPSKTPKPPPQPKTPTTPPTQQTNKRGDGSAKKDSYSPKKKAKQGQPQPSPNTGKGRHKNKKEESGSDMYGEEAGAAAEPRRITIVVSSNDDPKFSQDDAR